MRWRLDADVPVYRLVVVAKMAWLERRPEVGVLCRAARRSGRRIVAETVETVVPGLPVGAVENVVGCCHAWGLCDRGGALTADGEAAAENDEVAIPEEGKYRLWVANHSFLRGRVLAVERVGMTESVETQSTTWSAGWIRRGRFRSAVKPEETFVVREIHARDGRVSGVVESTKASVGMVWNIDFERGSNAWQLFGTLEAENEEKRSGKKAREIHQEPKNETWEIRHEPESTGVDLWGLVDGLASGPLAALGRWNSERRRLEVGFEGLREVELERFRKKFELSGVEVPSRGTFKRAVLEEVPLAPASSEDAQRWAWARFERACSKEARYRTRSELRRMFASVTEGTPLEEFRPVLPGHEELLGRMRRGSETFWHVAAPVDLAPWEPSVEELGPMRVGEARTGDAGEKSDVVRIGYGTEVSMESVVRRLLGEVVPRRILLCDRYVRGRGNLATLEVVMDSLRRANPDVVVDVWTEVEDAALQTIRVITGRTPRDLRGIYGAEIPHDRYLVIEGRDGEMAGWQMTNSILHPQGGAQKAGPDDSLRWHDFGAVRVPVEGLDTMMQRWARGEMPG